MLTMSNPLTIEGYTVYHDDSDEIQALLEGSADPGAPRIVEDMDGNPTISFPRRPRAAGEPPRRRRFYVLPETPTIAKDERGKPIFSLIVYRRDEDRLDPAATDKDVGGGILTFTVELTVPPQKFDRIKARLRSMVFGADASDPAEDVDLAYVPFLDGKVSVAVAGESGAETGTDREFVKGMVGTGKISGVGANRKAVMVKLTQDGAALMSQIQQLNTLPINVSYELSFEHRLLGVTMRVWCDVSSSYHLIQETIHESDEYDDGYLGLSENHVSVDKITSVTEVMVRSKTAGVVVIPHSSAIEPETLLSLEKFGFDLLNKEMEKALQAAPPPAELDRSYIEKYFADFANHFNFSLDRRMVLVRNFTPSANISNVFREADWREMVAFVDLRTAFFTFLKVPIRVNADFSKLPLDSVTVTVVYQRQRFDGSGREEVVDSFNFTDGSTIQTFLAYANSLADVTYDWSATVHYKGSDESYTFKRTRVKDEFLVVDVGALGMLQVDLGLGLVDLDKFPKAKVSVRYESRALGRTLQQDFLLSREAQNAPWTEVIHEEPTRGYEYKVDWLRKDDGDILEGEWTHSTASRLRFDAPVPDQLVVKAICTGNFKDSGDQIATVAVSLLYHDPDNQYTQEGQLAFTDDKQVLDWKVDLRNRELREYQYKYSIVYKDGVVKHFPEEGGWYKGEPGFITVGEKYTLEVELFPNLLTYPDHAKLVQVDLTYEDPGQDIRETDSFVFTKESNQPRTWRVRGTPGGPKRYTAEVKYYSALGAVTKAPAMVRDSEALVVPVAPPPAPPA
jgi:hypothetical protein